MAPNRPASFPGPDLPGARWRRTTRPAMLAARVFVIERGEITEETAV